MPTIPGMNYHKCFQRFAHCDLFWARESPCFWGQAALRFHRTKNTGRRPLQRHSPECLSEEMRVLRYLSCVLELSSDR